MTDETPVPVTPEAESPAPVVSDETPKPAVPSEEKVQKRIDELTWRVREYERQLAEAWKPPEPEAPKPVSAPKLEDFEYDQSKYLTAMQEWQDARIEARVTERLEKAEKERVAKERARSFEQKQQDFMAKTPDYAEKVLAGADRGEWPCSEVMAELIRESDVGPQVAYYLASNPQVARELTAMGERAAAREMGRIEARFDKSEASTETPKAVRVSQAPPPPAKIDSSEGTVSIKATDPESDSLSDAAWLASRKRQVARKKA